MWGCEWYQPITLTLVPPRSESFSATAMADASCSGLASTRSCEVSEAPLECKRYIIAFSEGVLHTSASQGGSVRLAAMPTIYTCLREHACFTHTRCLAYLAAICSDLWDGDRDVRYCLTSCIILQGKKIRIQNLYRAMRIHSICQHEKAVTSRYERGLSHEHRRGASP